MEAPPSIGAATASKAGVVTPIAAKRSAHTPRRHARAHAVAEERRHRREPVARDSRGLLHGLNLVGRRDAPDLGEDRPGVGHLGVGQELSEERVHRR